MRDPILLILPNDHIIFRGSITSPGLTTTIILKNPDPDPVLYKVKTTKPDRYCVSPAHGIIAGYEQLELFIKLKESGLASDIVAKDKFLLQTIHSSYVTKGVAVEDAFKRIKYADIMQQKMQVDVVYEKKHQEVRLNYDYSIRMFW